MNQLTILLLALVVSGTALATEPRATQSRPTKLTAALMDSRIASQGSCAISSCACSSSQDDAVSINQRLILAGGCSDACRSNLNQCLRGCDGAQSCSEQCRRNYDGCMSGCRD
jgi:hypothetical protein